MLNNLRSIKVAGTIAGVSIYFIFRALNIPGMEPEAQGLFALLLAAVVFWLTTPIPMYLTGLLIAVLPWALGLVSFETAFSGFSGGTFWFLFAALGIAGCIHESGVARRIALWLVSRAEPTFPRLMFIILVVMFILGYILPLGVARVALMLAILTPLIALFGVPGKSNIGKAITIAVAMFGMATSWQILTGGAPGLIMWGSLAELGYEVSWLQWAAIMVVPTLLVLFIMHLAITRMFRPEVDIALGGRENVKQELESLGPMKPVEKRSLIILGVIMLFWLTEPLHHIETNVVGIIGVFIFLLPAVGTTSFDIFIKKLIPWPLLVFVGAVISLAAMAVSTGMDIYINQNVVAPVYSITDGSFMFVISTWILNTAAGAMMINVPSIPLFAAPITEAAASVGLSPVIGALIYLSCFPQMLFYCAVPFFPMAMNYGTIEARDWIKAGLVFFFAWPLAHIICIFTWYPLLELMGII
jgi:sodium-dependent dicarboxylate transporter 2/3/5